MVSGERPVSLSRVLRRFAAASSGSLWCLAPVLKDGRKISGGKERWFRARESGALSDLGLWHLHCVVHSIEC